jgi:HPt (histidine-containing phosphotransfer) domain-containing protein
MEEDFDSLLQVYLEDSERQLHDVSDGWEEGDLDRVRRSAHSLKGASSNVGAVALASLCSHLETLAVEGCIEAVPQALDRVRSELREVRDAVMAVRQRH